MTPLTSCWQLRIPVVTGNCRWRTHKGKNWIESVHGQMAELTIHHDQTPRIEGLGGYRQSKCSCGLTPSVLEEFVKWIFAEEQTISAGATGKFKLRVSGCSRPELDGDYVQQKEFYYRRPIFHCRENERYLFYHGKRHRAAS